MEKMTNTFRKTPDVRVKLFGNSKRGSVMASYAAADHLLHSAAHSALFSRHVSVAGQ
jgi:hypothetical protein